MSGFFVLDLPEFSPLVDVARRLPDCRILEVRAGYRFVEFSDEIELRRADTGMGTAVWFGCMTGGLDGKIVAFDDHHIRLAPTNEPIKGV